jgi:hypothetical protein
VCVCGCSVAHALCYCGVVAGTAWERLVVTLYSPMCVCVCIMFSCTMVTLHAVCACWHSVLCMDVFLHFLLQEIFSVHPTLGLKEIGNSGGSPRGFLSHKKDFGGFVCALKAGIGVRQLMMSRCLCCGELSLFRRVSARDAGSHGHPRRCPRHCMGPLS